MSNSNTNSTFSFDAWEKSALSELDTLQNHVSKALMKYQSNTDKTALAYGYAADSEPRDRLRSTSAMASIAARRS